MRFPRKNSYPPRTSRRAHPTPPSRRTTSALGCLLVWAFAPSLAVGAEQPIFYLIDLREPASHLIRVTMTVPEARPGTEIQFPTWNALYQIRDFVHNVQELGAKCDGEPYELGRVDLHTWRSRAETCASLEVRYAVYADEEGVFSSVLNDQHSFMNFALLLFYLPRERQREIHVRFLLPTGWKLTTLLEEGETPGEFRASGYDVLADSPAEAGPEPHGAGVGELQEYDYTQGGATYRVVVHADSGAYSPQRLLRSLQKITAVATDLMRDVPFKRYTFILHFPREGGGGGMEHRDGTAISFPAAGLRSHWERFEATVAHEFFHAWIVKRIRPQNLEPVDYLRGNDTRDLWWAEGVTDTYTDLALVRAGLITRHAFYNHLAGQIKELQARPARHFQSAEESGREAWLEKYPDYLRPERSISYYNKGALLGFLLDLGIRHASRNLHGLDDLMRRLNEDFARRGRFFTQADVRALVRELAPADQGLDDFFRDYLSGTRELDYETYLGYAGLRLVSGTADRPALGFLPVQNFDGPLRVVSVDPGGNAQKAGLERGDILLKMNGRALTEVPLDQVSRMKPGDRIQLQVLRGNRVFDVAFVLGRKRETTYRVEEMTEATPEQLKVREGWLEGKGAARPATGEP